MIHVATFPAGSTTCTARASFLGLHALSARVRGPRRPLTLPPGPHPPQERGVAHVQERKKVKTAHRKFLTPALPVRLEAGMPLAWPVTAGGSRDGMARCCYKFRFSGDSFKGVSPGKRQRGPVLPAGRPGRLAFMAPADRRTVSGEERAGAQRGSTAQVGCAVILP